MKSLSVLLLFAIAYAKTSSSTRGSEVQSSKSRSRSPSPVRLDWSRQTKGRLIINNGGEYRINGDPARIPVRQVDQRWTNTGRTSIEKITMPGGDSIAKVKGKTVSASVRPVTGVSIVEVKQGEGRPLNSLVYPGDGTKTFSGSGSAQRPASVKISTQGHSEAELLASPE